LFVTEWDVSTSVPSIRPITVVLAALLRIDHD
jgi:hypothetical protein